MISGDAPRTLGESNSGPRSDLSLPDVLEDSEMAVAHDWRSGKVFGTSFGHPGDFAEESFTRMLVNSVCWAVDKPVPGPDEKVSTWEIGRADKRKGNR